METEESMQERNFEKQISMKDIKEILPKIEELLNRKPSSQFFKKKPSLEQGPLNKDPLEQSALEYLSYLTENPKLNGKKNYFKCLKACEPVLTELVKLENKNINSEKIFPLLAQTATLGLDKVFTAILFEYDELVKEIINAGQNLSYLPHQRTLVHFAVEGNSSIILFMLLLRGAKADGFVSKSKDLSSVNVSAPLHHAAKKGYFECVKLLVENGATLNIKNADGLVPYQLASNSKCETFLAERMHAVGIEIPKRDENIETGKSCMIQ